MKSNPYGGKVIRNLICHIWPVKGRGVWQWNVAQLLRRISQFDGQRIVSVVTGPGTDTLADVKAAFQGTVRDFLHFQNDPVLGEGVSFEELMHRVENIDPRQVTYYCHAKGVKYTANDKPTPTRADKSHVATGSEILVQIKRWAEVMHSTCLDYPALIDDALLSNSIVGTFVKHGQFSNMPRAWHYAGTFFWLRNQAIFGGDWRRVAKQWWGVEAWPGSVAAREKAACLLHEGHAPGMRMYERGYWTKNIDPVWKQWQQDHAPLKRAALYAELLPHLRLGNAHRIMVTGPQRSGTQIAAKIIAHDLKLPFIEEREFGTHDLGRFMGIVNGRNRYVIHAPSMSAHAHQVPGLVIWMRRDIGDVIRSQHRVGWQEHGLHHGSLERDKYFTGDTEPSAAFKVRAWQAHQSLVLASRGLDLDYESLRGHKLWVDSDARNGFAERQTEGEYPCKGV